MAGNVHRVLQNLAVGIVGSIIAGVIVYFAVRYYESRQGAERSSRDNAPYLFFGTHGISDIFKGFSQGVGYVANCSDETLERVSVVLASTAPLTIIDVDNGYIDKLTREYQNRQDISGNSEYWSRLDFHDLSLKYGDSIMLTAICPAITHIRPVKDSLIAYLRSPKGAVRPVTCKTGPYEPYAVEADATSLLFAIIVALTFLCVWLLVANRKQGQPDDLASAKYDEIREGIDELLSRADKPLPGRSSPEQGASK